MAQEQNANVKKWALPWVHQIEGAYRGGASQTFILHGNVHDLVRVEKKSEVSYAMLPEFLATQVFGSWDLVVYYDQVRGPRALALSQERLNKINLRLERLVGPIEELKALRDPGKVFALLDRALELILLQEGERPSVAVILDYAHFLVPSTAVSYTSRELASNLATLLNWSKSPYFKKAAFAFCLISERLNDLNSSLIQNAHTVKIEIPYPGLGDRLDFLKWMAGEKTFFELAEVDADGLARLTPGLTLIHLQGLMNRALRAGNRILLSELKTYKKQMIESQCEGLVEFLEPKHTLDLAVGHEAAKKRLRDDAQLLQNGQLDAVPMGYLICGSVGTGKTFLAECYAGSVGVPCLKLLNFRSKYVGETEGNLEKILKVLRVMGPVVVIIDEADAMLGDREMEGDSGTSGRVFGQFASQMGDTANRGKIIWFLLTCRPDLLPIDLKRQGRCEVHIPLFTPESPDEIKQMFMSMAKKNKVKFPPEAVPEIKPGVKFTGADIEGIVMRAKRLALLENCEDLTREHLTRALDGFIPSAETDEKQLQTLAAILECTDLDFLPPEFYRQMTDPEKRVAVLSRFNQLKIALK